LGDIDASSYRYLDEWLRLSLIAAIETLQPWWNYKYLIDENDDVARNTTIKFLHVEPRKDKLLQRDWTELTNILKPPQRRLASSNKGHLPGYVGSLREYE
jgi:hypothetical protein